MRNEGLEKLTLTGLYEGKMDRGKQEGQWKAANILPKELCEWLAEQG